MHFIWNRFFSLWMIMSKFRLCFQLQGDKKSLCKSQRCINSWSVIRKCEISTPASILMETLLHWQLQPICSIWCHLSPVQLYTTWWLQLIIVLIDMSGCYLMSSVWVPKLIMLKLWCQSTWLCWFFGAVSICYCDWPTIQDLSQASVGGKVHNLAIWVAENR